MATKKPRVNVVLEPTSYVRLSELAKESGESRSEIVRQFVSRMLEIVEDSELARMATQRRKSGGRRLSHHVIWGRRPPASRDR